MVAGDIPARGSGFPVRGCRQVVGWWSVGGGSGRIHGRGLEVSCNLEGGWGKKNDGLLKGRGMGEGVRG